MIIWQNIYNLLAINVYFIYHILRVLLVIYIATY